MVTQGGGADDGATTEVDLLVALEHTRLVQGALPGVGVTEVSSTESPALGLTRLVGALTPEAVAASTQADPVREVLRRLRASFRDEYAGWSPTMGRNRLVGQVSSGGGTVSHGGGPDPVPASPRPPRSGRAGTGLTVGVLDTGLFASDALAGGYLAGAPDDFLAEPPDGAPRPYASGHATFVAGLVLREAPGATVRVRKVLDERGQASSWDVANAIVEIGRTGVQILNLSFVCYTEDGRPPMGLATAVDRLDPEILVIACAGNHGDPDLGFEDEVEYRRPSWPAALDDVVAVGSARRVPDAVPGYALAPFTPRGAAWIDVVVPGEDLESTYFRGGGVGRDGVPATFDGWARWSGTSFSAALLAGKVAAVASEQGVSAREAYRRLRDPVTVHEVATAESRTLPPFLDL